MSKSEKKAINNGVKKKTVAIFVVCALAAGVVFGGLGMLIYKEISGNAAERLDDGEVYDFEKAGYIKLGEYKGLTADVQPSDEDVYSGMIAAVEDAGEDEETDEAGADEGADAADTADGADDTNGADAADMVDEADNTDGTDEPKLGEPVENGDLVNLDFTGMLDGEELEDASEEDAYVWIGKGAYIDDFEKGIIGIRVGEEKTIDCKFPADYDDETLAGKTVQFAITVLAKCGDKAAQEVTEGKCSTVQEYYEYEKAAQLEENRSNKGELVWDDLKDDVKVESAPKKMLERANEDVTKMYASFAEVSGMEVNELLESFGMDEDGLEEIANDTVTDIMIAKTIAAKEGITMDDEYYRQALMEVLGSEDSEEKSGTLEELEAEYKENMGSRPRDEMLIEKVKDFVGENTKEGSAEDDDALVLE